MNFTKEIEQIKKANKISIFGCPGSGKSTLSKELSLLLEIKTYHLDNIYWKPNWVSLSKEEFDKKLNAIMNYSSWILDGNYNRTLDSRLENSDFVVYLDMKRMTCLLSAVKRYFQYRNKRREDITEGCDEVLDKEFLTYIWNFNKEHREEYYKKIGASNKPYIILKSRKEVKKFIKELEKSKKS